MSKVKVVLFFSFSTKRISKSLEISDTLPYNGNFVLILDLFVAGPQQRSKQDSGHLDRVRQSSKILK